MKYQDYNITISKEKREDINNKILAIIDGNVSQHDIKAEDIFNCYTGKGGLHGLDFNDFDNYYEFSEAKKDYEKGQFFTPPLVCREMIELVKPQLSDLVCDPTCGTGNFFNFLPVEQNCYGCELDPQAVKVAKYLYPDAHIIKKDICDYKPEVSFDFVFGNPPFNLDFGMYKSQYYFSIKAAELLKPGGFLVLITPLSFLNDDFFVKTMSEWFDREFNFILQYKLSPTAFKNLGVENFLTKVMVFQKKSRHLEDRTYKHDSFAAGSSEELYNTFIKPLKEQNQAIRAELILESQKEKGSFDFIVNKLLYQIKINKVTAPYYAQCLEKLESFKTQEIPPDMSRTEWEKVKLTENKVISYLKRTLKKQHLAETDKIAFVKRDFGISLKAYSRKMKSQLNKLSADKYWHINDLVLSGSLPAAVVPGVVFPDGFKKLLSRKTREYKMQEQPFSELPRIEAIDRFLSDFRFIGKDDNAYCFNDVQKLDVGLSLQKRYSLLNWQMGSGKTAAAYAWAKFNMANRSIRNVFIISAAISIYLTWVTFMKNQKENFISVESISDISRIKPGMFVLVSLSRLTGKKVKSSNGSSCRVDLYKYMKDFIKRQSYKVGLIFDESDEITNPDAKRSRAVLACFRKIKYKLLATGTTTRNNIAELYKQLELLYNNSINMLCDCETIYSEVKGKNGDNGINERKNEEYYNKPFPAYYGNNLFKACFNPSKATVFGIKKQNQDIYNKQSLINLIRKTILTRLFREIAGPDKYEIKSHKLKQNSFEVELYGKIISELQPMIARYYESTGNARKDNMLMILRQLELLIKATSIPHHFDEYKAALPRSIPEDLQEYPLFRSNKQSVVLPNKYEYIENMINELSGKLVAVGCLSKESTHDYYNNLRKRFPDRKIFLCKGDIDFSSRNKLLKQFEASGSGILVATQQSLKSSVNIPSCNEIIVEALPWNVPKLLQFCFRFIRYDSAEKSTIHIINYEDTIDMNLFALLLAKERINDFVKTLDFKEQSDVYKEFDVDLDILNSILEKTRDREGKVRIEWGLQEVK